MSGIEEIKDKFIILTHSMIRDKNLTMQEKIIFIEILNLSSLKNGCIASNSHFEECFDISKKSISNTINSLVKKGYITSEITDRNHTRVLSIKDGHLSTKDGHLSTKDGHLSTKDGETIDNISSNISFNKTLKEKSEANNSEIDAKSFNKLNSHQKIQVLQERLNKHIGIVKTKIFKDDLLQAKEIVEQIEDPDDFISAYVEHKRSLKDKKYLKSMFAFMAEYVDGTFKSAKSIEDDYAITIHAEWVKLEDGNFAMLNGHVINPFTGNIIPGYWESRGVQ